jgi:secreted trypsin-like serine protease
MRAFGITISDGTPVTRGFSWAVGVGYSRTPTGAFSVRSGFLGGGTVISRHWVLTAAHLFFGRYDLLFDADNRWRPGAYQLRITTGRDLSSSSLPEIPIDFIQLHPSYSRTRSENDLALIHLVADLPDSIPVACSPPLAGTVATIWGWGEYRMNEGMPQGSALRSAPVIIRSADVCRAQRDPQGRPGDPRTMICAGGLSGPNVSAASGVCDVDSGSGLVQYSGTDESSARLVGIASWTSRECGSGNGTPDVFVLVPAYLPWIREVTGVSCVR